MMATTLSKHPTTEPVDGRWLTVRQAAERVGVDIRTIQRWEREGLRVCRRGRVVRIWSCDLDSFLREGR